MLRILQVHWGNGDIDSLLQIISRLLVVAVTTADCERGFSVLKLTKTALRNSLSEKNLNNAMLINIQGPPRDSFDFVKAKKRFNSLKCRRVV